MNETKLQSGSANMAEVTEADVEYTMECMPEDCGIEGNVMASGDEAYDREIEQQIIADLESGNQWAWCTVKVTARHPECPELKGVDYLGACSYKSEEDFRAPGGYYEQMKACALEDLLRQAESVVRVFGKASHE